MIIGSKYGNWTIISEVFDNKWNKKSVNCQCICGTVRIVEICKLNDLNECRKCHILNKKVSVEERKIYKAKYFQENKEKIYERRKKNPVPTDVLKNYQLKYLYNTSIDEIDAFYIVQKGRCYICKRPFFGENKVRMVIDHDHKTNLIRSLLCHGCNVGLGNFKEDINSLKNAVKYLEKI